MIAGDELPRLLRGSRGRPLTVNQHDEIFGSVAAVHSTVEELEASGLTGRGGAGFATARKVRLLREQRGHHKFVVINAMEGEPASHKDRTLLSTNPHLVLDGALVLASMVGARRVAICAARDNPTVTNHLQRAIHERQRSSSRGPALELHSPPWRYVAGEESALVHWLDDNASLPQYRPNRPHILRIGHAPVLVDNAETCAHVGLIARYGADWFRRLGTDQSPGSALVSLSGAVSRPTVLEVALGTPLRAVLAAGGADGSPRAVLVGGYGGSWLAGRDLDLPFANESLQRVGVSVGAGVLVVLPEGACGLLETHRIVKWMAHESARQCGPCAFGLPALASDLERLVRGVRDADGAHDRLIERCGAIEGRGACRHPDGVVRLVRSAMTTFVEDVAAHRAGFACAASASTEHFATVPLLEREEELVWE